MTIQDGCQQLIFDTKITILAVDHHCDHRVSLIVFILGQKVAKYMDIPCEKDWLKLEIKKAVQEAVFSLFVTVKMTHLSLDHHGD